jgi:hypothetical protein
MHDITSLSDKIEAGFAELREELVAVIDKFAARMGERGLMDREGVCSEAFFNVARVAYAARGGTPAKAAQLLHELLRDAIEAPVAGEDIDATA